MHLIDQKDSKDFYNAQNIV